MTRCSPCESEESDPGSVCVEMVVVEAGRAVAAEEEEEEEGRRTCSWVFSLITSS